MVERYPTQADLRSGKEHDVAVGVPIAILQDPELNSFIFKLSKFYSLI
jgi:hypothetical protein